MKVRVFAGLLLALIITTSFAFNPHLFSAKISLEKGKLNNHEFHYADEDSTDVLEAVLAMNKRLGKPKANFKEGHVKTRDVSGQFKVDRDWTIIQLPKAGMTPSPTYYDGKVYVSGGFGSKEFYAFDARTGEVVWAIDLDDDGPSSAVIQDGIVIFNTESCTIFAVDAQTGKQLWSYWMGDPLMSTPTIANGMVFTAYPARGLGGYGNMYQNNVSPVEKEMFQQNAPLNISNNTIDTKKPDSNDDSDDSDDDETEKRIEGTHIFIAIDIKTGKIQWQKWIDGDVLFAPIAEGKELYVTSFAGTFYKFDQKTGEIISANATRATSAPSIIGKEIYMSRRSDKGGDKIAECIAVMGGTSKMNIQRQYNEKAAPYLDAEIQNKSELKKQSMNYDAGNGFSGGAPANSGWMQASKNIGQSNVSSLQAFQGSRVLHVNGKNYNTMGDELVCTDPESGETLWNQKIQGDMYKKGGFLATPPLHVGNRIIIATLNGDVVIFDAESGKEIKKFELKDGIRYQPIVQDGVIYVTTLSGKLVRIDTGDTSLTGWVTSGANAAHTNRVE